MSSKSVFAALAVALSLTACAGRPPAPVAVVQPADAGIDCQAIMAQVQTNDAKITELGRDQGAKVAQNIAAGVAGLFIWPLWFAMDFQGTAGTEIAALQSRQTYLATLANQKGCAGPAMHANQANWK
jgi:hypothetical protein